MATTASVDSKKMSAQTQFPCKMIGSSMVYIYLCLTNPHAAITADCIVFGYDPNKTLRVLLVKRRNEPYKDCWAFPGGFMEIDEDLETCARREVMEETGMALGEVFQFRS